MINNILEKVGNTPLIALRNQEMANLNIFAKLEFYNPTGSVKERVIIAESWEEAYSEADIFITCTVSKDRYIDKQPKPGSLHLNVSLRDYKPEVFKWFSKGIIVDDWEEVCRENTDIEMLHKTNGLQKRDVIHIQDIQKKNYFNSLDKDQAIMFNPMGMAIFDIAMADNYLELAVKRNIGVLLED